MSTINTSAIDVNYPIPGQNNNTQGFRDNFASIKQNLTVAGNEITDLQNKVVLKSALANSTLNNDMANTLIANASTLQFRATEYNLGGALVDGVLISCVLGDVQYGTLAGNIVLDFGSWVPTGTWGGVELHLRRPDTETNYSISWPPQAVIDSSHGWDILENSDLTNNPHITFPHGVTQINLKVFSDDCGSTIYVQPLNRPYQATQIQKRTPPSTGQLGDIDGTLSIGNSVSTYNITATYATGNYLQTTSTANLYRGQAVNFTGNVFETTLLPGATYYVANISNTTHFTVSHNANAVGNVAMSGGSGNMAMTPVGYLYIATDTYSANAVSRNIISTTAPNIITASSSSNLAIGNPVIFTGSSSTASLANVVLGQVYYIRSVSGTNITIGVAKDNGIVGAEKAIGTVNTSQMNSSPMDFTVYDGGPDVVRKLPLPWGTTVASSADIPDLSKLRIGGGTSGYYLQTDGAGNLAWTVGGGSGSGVTGGSNTQVQFNDAGNFGGNAGFTFNKTTGVFSVPSSVVSGGNVSGLNFVATGNLSVAGNTSFNNLTITGNLELGNVHATGEISADGNIFTAANIYTTDSLSVEANAIISDLFVSGNAVLTSTYTYYLELGSLSTPASANIMGNISATLDIHSNANVSASQYMLFSSKDGITATGSAQGDAWQLDSCISIVGTVGAGAGVRLPAAITGARLIVRNNGANALKVYPNTGDQINSLGVNAAYSLATTTGIEFYCANAVAQQWYTL